MLTFAEILDLLRKNRELNANSSRLSVVETPVTRHGIIAVSSPRPNLEC